MGLLGTLLRTTIHVVTLPVDVVKDVATMGGVLTDEREPYAVKKARKIKEDAEDIEDDVDRL
jgi:hypothetical protein